jgi:DNA-binding transcriptional MerR regulator
MEVKLERRVSAAELAQALGITRTWLRALERAGKIPAARRDVGARRKYWTEAEARAIVAGSQGTEQRAAA